MPLVLVLGWTAATLSSLAALPQLRRTLRVAEAGGLSVPAFQLITGLSTSWVVHGLISGHPNLVVSNTVLGVTACLIITAATRYRPAHRLAVYLLPAIVAVTLITVRVLTGPAIYGALAAAVAVTAQLGQSREVVRSATITGLSATYLAWMVLNQTIWLSWGILKPDPAIATSAVAMFCVAAFNLSWYWHRRLRRI